MRGQFVLVGLGGYNALQLLREANGVQSVPTMIERVLYENEDHLLREGMMAEPQRRVR
jgi:hypothetical protein